MTGEIAAVTCYFNPCGYRNRQVAYHRFAEGLRRQGMPLWVIEATLPDQNPHLPPGPRTFHLRLPPHNWLWQKERLLNLLIHRLPPAVDRVCWIDCDVLFVNDDWPVLAEQALETWPVVQLFDFAFWLGPNDEVMFWDGPADRRQRRQYRNAPSRPRVGSSHWDAGLRLGGAA